MNLFKFDDISLVYGRRGQNPAALMVHFHTVSHRKNQFLDFQGLHFSEELFSEHRPSRKNPNTTKDSPSKTQRGGKF